MKTLTLKLERLAGRLAVYIPDDATTRFQLTEGQPVILSIPTTADEASNARKDAMTLAQKLALYDPETMGGEVIVDIPIGKEIIR